MFSMINTTNENGFIKKTTSSDAQICHNFSTDLYIPKPCNALAVLENFALEKRWKSDVRRFYRFASHDPEVLRLRNTIT